MVLWRETHQSKSKRKDGRQEVCYFILGDKRKLANRHFRGFKKIKGIHVDTRGRNFSGKRHHKCKVAEEEA